MSPINSLVFGAIFFTTITLSDAYSSLNIYNDYSFQSGVFGRSEANLFDPYLKPIRQNESCEEIWCDALEPYERNILDDEWDDELNNGYWLEPPPDDILYMPFPPIPPSLQALLLNMENDTLRELMTSDDPEKDSECNLCKLFADPKLYADEDTAFSAASKNTDSFVSSFYLMIFSIIILVILIMLVLIKYKNDSCPILASSLFGHHKSSNSPTSPSETRISPVVNEKSPQSIIMDAPLATLGKKSTISTTGKYWKRIPNTGNGTMFFMEDRHGIRALGGSSTGISDHPYSDATSCTSSPVYAELDPSVAGSCNTPPLIRPGMATSFSPYPFSNTYTEVPDSIRSHHALTSSLLSDSSTYDNAAYLPATSQPFLPQNHYTSRSLRRLAAQRAAAMNAANGQLSTPLLAGQPYHPYPPTPQQAAGQFHFLTGGRPLKKPRLGQQQPMNYTLKYGNHRPAMNHYVTQNDPPTDNRDLIDDRMTPLQFSSFIDQNTGPNHRKSSSSSQYTEMPLLNASPFAATYRMSETHSSNDLNSASSSSSGGSAGSTNTSSATSSTSLKRPLPPVPGGVRI